jgi:2-phosphoglycerate kinase
MIRIKVHIENHFYFLSRYLISRILKMIKISEFHAVKIALDIKKRIVTQDKIEISQEELEQLIFKMM